VTSIVVGKCPSCGAERFPLPLWCDVCGSYRIEELSSPSGLVTEVTIVRHVPGHSLPPVRLGTVRLDGGAVVVARLEAAVGEGSRVDVVVEDGAPIARPRLSLSAADG
jgi:uncharacterized OB-fold protein